jgi:hypothetical protein
MPIDDQPIVVALREFREAYKPSTEAFATSAAQSALFSLIPGVGAALEKLSGDREKYELSDRLHTLFNHMLEYIEEHPGSLQKPDYYQSLAFREAVSLTLDTLYSSRNDRKIRLLAAALANSGTDEIADADEQMHMLRALRDLTPGDIRVLGDWRLKGWVPITRRIAYGPDVLTALHRLSSFGFVVDHHQRPDPNTADEEKLKYFLRHGQVRTFKLSPFGERFLSFLAAGSTTQPAGAESEADEIAFFESK